MEKLRENPDRDQIARATELDSQTDVLRWSPEPLKVAWMVQELRISLFAQPIGVRGSVSEQRVEVALEDLLT